MRKIIIALGLLCLCGAVQAKPVKPAKPAKPANGFKAAIAKLNALSDSGISWNIAKAKTADVTCSGGADRVLFGTSKTSVWIGIVPAKAKPQLMDFPLTRKTQNGFCALPKKISLTPLSCAGPENGKLQDCRPVKSCKEFSLDDGGCDPFNFYWDSRHEILRWWRN